MYNHGGKTHFVHSAECPIKPKINWGKGKGEEEGRRRGGGGGGGGEEEEEEEDGVEEEEDEGRTK